VLFAALDLKKKKKEKRASSEKVDWALAIGFDR